MSHKVYIQRRVLATIALWIPTKLILHIHKQLTGPMLMQCVKLSSALICVRHSFTAQDLRYLLWILS